MFGIFLWAAKTFYDIVQAPSNARTIYVTGRQWMWKVQHPEGRQEINSLHVPLGEPVRLVLRSQDVIHSFYVPVFRLKQDVLPGRYTSLWFVANQEGEFHLFCAEYCGVDPSLMRGTIRVMKPEAFEKWLTAEAEEPAPIPETPGALGGPMALHLPREHPFRAFGCVSCHLPNANVLAPRLDSLFGTPVRLKNDETVIADEQYIRESILYPNARIVAGYDSPSLMPTFQGQISEEEMIELIEFIKSLDEGWAQEEINP